MKRFEIIQKIIASFTRKPVFSGSTESISIEASSPMTTIANIPSNKVKIRHSILSRLLIASQTTLST